jgi:predicted enzyme related to lactoylglutathione lyase
MKISGIDNVFIEVGDLDEALRFYHDTLGLPVHRRFDAMHSILFAVGSETPGLGVAAVAEPRVGGQKVWFEVADARSAAAELHEAGVSVCSEAFLIPTGWAVEVRDPWGNVIGLTDYSSRPEHGRA